MPDLAAVVVNYRRPDLLEACLASLEEALEQAGGGELVVVDNASGDRSVELVRDRFRRARLVELAVNRGFGAGVNAGLHETDAEWVFLLNNDATVAPRALAELLRVGRTDPRVASVAAQMRFAARPEVINSAGLDVDRLGVVSDRLVGMPASASEQEPVEVFGASGGAGLYRRAPLDDIGGFDEGFFMFGEDADVAWRMRMRGWRSLYAPGAVVFHHHSASSVHASESKYFQVGRSRVRLLARNTDRGLLVRYGPAMVLYDLAYIAFVGVRDRSLGPLRGRLAGLREWRAARRSAAGGRRPVELAPVRGVRAALARRRAWLEGGSRLPAADAASERPN